MQEEYTNYLIGADEKYIKQIFKAEIIGLDYKNELKLEDRKIYGRKIAEDHISQVLRRIHTKIRLVHQKGGGGIARKIKRRLNNIKDIEILSLDNFIEKYANDITSKNTLQR